MTEQHPTTIYKVTTDALWAEGQQTGILPPSPIDVTDGYMHLSTAEQLDGTLRLHFAGQSGLVLVAIGVASLADHMKWEPSRGGALFPHYYADMKMAFVSDHAPVSVDVDGNWDKPEFFK